MAYILVVAFDNMDLVVYGRKKNRNKKGIVMDKYELVGSKTCKEVLAKYPEYKVFWRGGYAFKGAKEVEDDKQPEERYVWQERANRVLSFEERMQRRYDESVVIDIDVDHEKKEIHFNGFSGNDMF